MPTINQLVRKARRQQYRKPKHPAMQSCPQKRGVCLQVKTMTPKKPKPGGIVTVKGTACVTKLPR